MDLDHFTLIKMAVKININKISRPENNKYRGAKDKLGCGCSMGEDKSCVATKESRVVAPHKIKIRITCGNSTSGHKPTSSGGGS